MLAPLYARLFQAAPMGCPILLETEIKSIPIGVNPSKNNKFGINPLYMILYFKIVFLFQMFCSRNYSEYYQYLWL